MFSLRVDYKIEAYLIIVLNALISFIGSGITVSLSSRMSLEHFFYEMGVWGSAYCVGAVQK